MTILLEIFNEVIIMLTLYILFIFSDMYDDYLLKYMGGWVLNLTIIGQFIINSVVIVVSSFIDNKKLIINSFKRFDSFLRNRVRKSSMHPDEDDPYIKHIITCTNETHHQILNQDSINTS